ncbi:hypothetical protein C900_02673 [Fulvivirga imtechensis AK7]|uniref:Uncharacterized protein n=1 Tax=Fulvivirga imtechensis AK7 TaxID=1237149 RepID=L8JZK0_9BACT|nr:hypothetical protein C900_02673 [Fulvivirga imtechensis AK7]
MSAMEAVKAILKSAQRKPEPIFGRLRVGVYGRRHQHQYS